MNELIQVGEKTYYLSGPFHVGVYVFSENIKTGKKEVCLIDSGVDKVVARVLDKRLMEKDFTVSCIINTHYHADHSGGNNYFQTKYNCHIYSTKVNADLISNFDICPAIIWGGKPIDEILNNYFYAQPSTAEDMANANLPNGLKFVDLSGHSLSHIGVKTSDDVFFLGDAVVSNKTIDSHPLTYIYDVEEHFKTLKKLRKMEAALFVPYHAEPVKNIKNLCDKNKKCMEENIALIREICAEPRSMDEIISMFYNKRGLKLSLYKYAVEGGIVRTYLTYLYNRGEMMTLNEDNYLKWKMK